jgi:hypothetical protein
MIEKPPIDNHQSSIQGLTPAALLLSNDDADGVKPRREQSLIVDTFSIQYTS